MESLRISYSKSQPLCNSQQTCRTFLGNTEDCSKTLHLQEMHGVVRNLLDHQQDGSILLSSMMKEYNLANSISVINISILVTRIHSETTEGAHRIRRDRLSWERVKILTITRSRSNSMRIRRMKLQLITIIIMMKWCCLRVNLFLFLEKK